MDLGSGIRDPRSEIRDPEKTYSGFRIPDPGVKKARDPGSLIRIRNTDKINSKPAEARQAKGDKTN
jgi:hypothetical protein